jgi:hypothetical protein
MITDMNARVAMAQKLSIPQLQQAIKNGTVPAYVGVPLLQDKMRQQQQMAMAQQGQQAQQQPPIAEQIMAEASRSGVDQLPSNLPITDDEEDYANGGIVAFAEPTAQNNNSRVTDPDVDVLERMRIEDPKGYARMMREIPQVPPGLLERSLDASGRLIPPFSETPEGQVSMNDPMVDIGMGRATDVRMPSTGVETIAPKTATTSPTRGSLTEGLTPASIKASEDQLPKAIAALPGATKTTGTGNKVANIPLTTGEMRSDVAAGKGSMLDQYAAMLMDERKGIAKDRQQAKAMAIFQAGLGIAGGTSPNPFANISQGALPATQAYQQEMRGIRKEDSDRLKQLMGLGISKEKLELEAKKLGITEKRFNQMYDLETAKLGVMGGQRADSRAQAEELRRLSVAQGLFSTLRKDQLMSGLSDEELWSRAQRMAGQEGTTPVASSGSTVMGSYVPGKGYIPNK